MTKRKEVERAYREAKSHAADVFNKAIDEAWSINLEAEIQADKDYREANYQALEKYYGTITQEKDNEVKDRALKDYYETVAQAREDYYKAKVQASQNYNRAKAKAEKDYEEAEVQALKGYYEVLGRPLQEVVEEAREELRKAINRLPNLLSKRMARPRGDVKPSRRVG